MVSQTIKVATAQVQTIADPKRALDELEVNVRRLSAQGADIVLFPEVYIGGFPRLSTFGESAVGKARSQAAYAPFWHHLQASVDLGDTPHGAGMR